MRNNYIDRLEDIICFFLCLGCFLDEENLFFLELFSQFFIEFVYIVFF